MQQKDSVDQRSPFAMSAKEQIKWNKIYHKNGTLNQVINREKKDE